MKNIQIYLLYLEDERREFLKDYIKENIKNIDIKKINYIKGRTKRDYNNNKLEKIRNTVDIKLIDEIKKEKKELVNYITDLDELVSKYYINKVIKLEGQYGHIDSMIRIIEEAKEKKLEKILILEDDIFIHKNFEEKQEEINNKIDEDIDIIYLGCSRTIKTIINNKEKKNSNVMGTFAIILRETVYDDYLNLLKKRIITSDMCLTILQKYYKTYVFDPNIIISDITETYIGYNHKNINMMEKINGWDKLNYILYKLKKETIETEKNIVKIKKIESMSRQERIEYYKYFL